MTSPRDLTAEELRDARLWWERLPERDKGAHSIWTILALYARHVLDTQTVKFDEGR
jgi:hypothetical protein